MIDFILCLLLLFYKIGIIFFEERWFFILQDWEFWLLIERPFILLFFTFILNHILLFHLCIHVWLKCFLYCLVAVATISATFCILQILYDIIIL